MKAQYLFITLLLLCLLGCSSIEKDDEYLTNEQIKEIVINHGFQIADLRLTRLGDNPDQSAYLKNKQITKQKLETFLRELSQAKEEMAKKEKEGKILFEKYKKEMESAITPSQKDAVSKKYQELFSNRKPIKLPSPL